MEVVVGFGVEFDVVGWIVVVFCCVLVCVVEECVFIVFIDLVVGDCDVFGGLCIIECVGVFWVYIVVLW